MAQPLARTPMKWERYTLPDEMSRITAFDAGMGGCDRRVSFTTTKHSAIEPANTPPMLSQKLSSPNTFCYTSNLVSVGRLR